MFHLLKVRTSIDIFRTEKCKVTFGLKYIIIIDVLFAHNSVSHWNTCFYNELACVGVDILANIRQRCSMHAF